MRNIEMRKSGALQIRFAARGIGEFKAGRFNAEIPAQQLAQPGARDDETIAVDDLPKALAALQFVAG